MSTKKTKSTKIGQVYGILISLDGFDWKHYSKKRYKTLHEVVFRFNGKEYEYSYAEFIARLVTNYKPQ